MLAKTKFNLGLLYKDEVFIKVIHFFTKVVQLHNGHLERKNSNVSRSETNRMQNDEF